MTRSLIGTAWRRALGQKNWRRSVLGACVGLLIAALILLLTQLGLLDALEWLTLDARFIARYLVAPEPERSPVTVVAIDDRSVLEYGRWPWPRAVQAELFTAILNANPSVLGVDIIYSELDDAWADSRLARALGQGQAPVVLALARAGDRELSPGRYLSFAQRPCGSHQHRRRRGRRGPSLRFRSEYGPGAGQGF